MYTLGRKFGPTGDQMALHSNVIDLEGTYIQYDPQKCEP